MSTVEKKKATGWDALALLLLPALCVFQGFVVMRLWGWHVVPVFGWPPLRLGHAVGLHTLFGILKMRSSPDDGKSLAHTFTVALAAYAIALLTGWLAT